MGEYTQNFGLEFLMEDEESLNGLISNICQEGKIFEGYYGYPYINMEYGWPQFVVRAVPHEESGHLAVSGMDTHISGITKWKVNVSGININRKDADVLEKRIIARRAEDLSGMTVINLVNADVVPSYLEGDYLTVQVVGFPEYIHYYADGKSYEADWPAAEDGKKLLLADGSILPTGFMMNHDPENPDCEKDPWKDDFNLIRGTVKKVMPGIVQFGEEKMATFCDVVINTQFGDLEIVHTMEQIDEKERDLIKVGSVVNGLFYLSGDVAVDEYKYGIVKDEEHTCRLIRSVFQEGNPLRLAAVLTEDSEYISEASEKSFHGSKEIMDRFQYVLESNPDKKYFAYLATITKIDDGEEKLLYQAGKRCVVLVSGDEHHYESISFVDLDEEGNIRRLLISTESRYHFKIDEEPEVPSILDDIHVPESIVVPIVARAKFHGYLNEEITEEEVMQHKDNLAEYMLNIENFAKKLPEDDTEFQEKYENVFGYLFAKAIEYDYADRHQDDSAQEVNYSIEDGLSGEITTSLPAAIEGKVKIALKYGKQFYKDLKFYRETHVDESDFSDDLEKALIVVQQIGEIYSQAMFE